MLRALIIVMFSTVLLVSGTGARAPQSNRIFEPEYRRAVPGYQYSFPRDHGSHPEYKLEWWYYTGHLNSDDGRKFGYELTFFRIGMDRHTESASRWTIRDLHVAHFAVTEIDEQRFRFFERLHREGPGIAWAREDTLDVKNSGWFARVEGDAMKLRAYAGGILMELTLTSDKDPVLHGLEGVSQKADGIGQASHYYSMTRMETRGMLSFDGQPISVSGESWMDHEFGTNQLATNQVGWDWFSVQLDSGEELMLYQLRHRNGSIDHNSSGTVVAVDGRTKHLAFDEFSVSTLSEWKSPRTKVIYKIDWRLEIPSIDADLRVIPLMDGQELVTTRSTGIAYWEGAVRIEGTWKGQTITGRGYVELTGYSERHRPNI